MSILIIVRLFLNKKVFVREFLYKDLRFYTNEKNKVKEYA